MEDIAYYVDRRAAGSAVVFCLILALAFLAFHLYLFPLIAEDPDLSVLFRSLARVTGIAGFAGSSALGVVFLCRLRSRKPYVLISTQGVYDNASGTCSGAGFIEWSAIADVRLSRYHNLPCVELVPKNRERFMQRFGWIERINRSSRLGYPAVAIRGRLLPVEPAVLAEQMRMYWQSFRRKPRPSRPAEAYGPNRFRM